MAQITRDGTRPTRRPDATTRAEAEGTDCPASGADALVTPETPDRAGQVKLLEQARHQIAAAIRDGAGLDSVEELIERVAVGAEDRDALWLYAWATTDLAHRRRCAQKTSFP